jgi:hypothetical protein
MKRAALLVVLTCLLISLPKPARAQDDLNEGVGYIEFALRPGLNDGIQICSDHDFASRAEAHEFAVVLGPTLGISGLTFAFDPSNYADCVDFFPPRPLTIPGPRPHERTFRIDLRAFEDALSKKFHLDLYEVEVCVPELPGQADPPQDLEVFQGDCDHPFQQSYDWFSPPGGLYNVQVDFAATPRSLLQGLAGVALFWGLVAGLMTLFVRRMRASGWRFFIKHRVIAWILDGVLMLVLLFGVIFVVPYWTNWIPSLQVYLNIGVVGEALLIALPSVALVFVMIGGPARQVRRLRPPPPSLVFAPPSPSGGGVPSLGVPDWGDR